MDSVIRNTSATTVVAICLIALSSLLMVFPYCFTGKTLLPYDLLLQMPPWRSLATGEAQNRMMSDVLRSYLPWRFLYRQALFSGEVPFWNPYSLGGMPFMANLQSQVFYPPGLLFLLGSVEAGLVLYLLFHHFVTGCGMYWLLRRQGLAMQASVAGALVWMFCGYLTVWLPWLTIIGTMAWFPWLLAATDWFIQTGNRRAAGLVSAFTGLAVLGGHLQFSYYCLITAGCLAIWQICSAALSWRQRLVRLLGHCGALAIGLTTVAFQLIPTFELASNNSRPSVSIESLMNGALPVSHAVTLLVPTFFGGQNNYWGAGNFVEFTAYAGLSSLILALFALFHPRLRRAPILWFFILMALVALHLSYGGALNRPLSLLPGYTAFRGLQRISSIWSLALACLTAWGVDALMRARGRRRLILGPLPVVLATGGFLVFGHTALVSQWLAERLQVYPPVSWKAWVLNSFEWASLMLIAVGGSMAFLLVSSKLPKRVAGLVALAPALVIVADLIHFARAYLPVVDTALAYPVTPGIAYLQQHKGDGRIARFGDSMLQSPMPANSGIVYGLEDLDAYDSFMIDDYNRLISIIEPERYAHAAQFNTLGNFRIRGSIDSPLLDLLGVGFVIAEQPLSSIVQDSFDNFMGELLPGHEIGQTFVPDTDGLSGIDVVLATYARRNQGQLRMELRPSPESTEVLASMEVEVARIADNRYALFRFPPIKDSAGRGFYFALRGLNGAPGNAVTVAAQSRDVYLGGSIWRDQQPVAGDLRFRAHTTGQARVAGWKQVYTGPDMTIYRNLEALPLAFLATGSRVEPQDFIQHSTLASAGLSPRGEVLLSVAPVLPIDPSARGTVEVVRRTLNSMDLTCDVDAATGKAGLVVIGQNHYPGWRAWIDGAGSDVLIADGAFQALAVPAGKHTIVLRYRPAYFRLALLASVAGWLMVLLLVVRRQQESAGSSAT